MPAGGGGEVGGEVHGRGRYGGRRPVEWRAAPKSPAANVGGGRATARSGSAAELRFAAQDVAAVLRSFLDQCTGRDSAATERDERCAADELVLFLVSQHPRQRARSGAGRRGRRAPRPRPFTRPRRRCSSLATRSSITLEAFDAPPLVTQRLLCSHRKLAYDCARRQIGGGDLGCCQLGGARAVSARSSACSRCSVRRRRARRAEPAAAGPGRHAARVPAGRRTERDLHDQAGPDAERRRAQADDRLGRRRRVRGLDAELRRARDRDPDRADRRQYTFRLRSDDGSELFIDDTLVIDHDGLHGADDKDGAIQLTAGRHALRVNFFEAGGGQELRLSWRKPGDSGFTHRPDLGPEHRPRRARDRSGHEAVRGRHRHARRRAAARRRQPRLRPRQPAAGRLRAEGDRPGVDGRRPARADLGRRRRRPEQRDRRRRGVEADRRQDRRRPRRRDAHEDRRGPA